MSEITVARELQEVRRVGYTVVAQANDITLLEGDSIVVGGREMEIAATISADAVWYFLKFFNSGNPAPRAVDVLSMDGLRTPQEWGEDGPATNPEDGFSPDFVEACIAFTIATANNAEGRMTVVIRDACKAVVAIEKQESGEEE